MVVGRPRLFLLSRSGPLVRYGLLFSPAAMIVAQMILVVADRCRDAADRRDRLASTPEFSLIGVDRPQARPPARRLPFRSTWRRWPGSGRRSPRSAVMIVGGNIDGFTRVMTTAIALETSKGDLAGARRPGIVMTLIPCAQRRRLRPDGGRGGAEDRLMPWPLRVAGVVHRRPARPLLDASISNSRARASASSSAERRRQTRLPAPRLAGCCRPTAGCSTGAARRIARPAQRWCSSSRCCCAGSAFANVEFALMAAGDASCRAQGADVGGARARRPRPPRPRQRPVALRRRTPAPRRSPRLGQPAPAAARRTDRQPRPDGDRAVETIIREIPHRRRQGADDHA